MATRLDSLLSAVTRIGTSLDPRKSYVFVKRRPLPPQEADDLFNGNDLAHTVCCILPEEALSEPWYLDADEDRAELKDKVSTRMTELKAVELFTDAAVFARVFGDTFLYMQVDDGLPNDRPLVPEKVRTVSFLRKIERDRLSPLTRYTDPRKPNFDEVETYQLTGTYATEVIHETRLLKFTGARTSDMDRRQNNMWHRSILDKIYEVLRDFGITWSSAALLVNQGTQGVYKVKDLSMLLAAPGAEGREALSTRIGLIDMVRSALNSLILDADAEDFDYKVAPLTSLPEVLDRFASRLSAASGGIPVTKLFGISPAGMNATGVSDAKNWYRILEAYRTTQIQPQVEVLLNLLLIEAGKPEAEIAVSWAPLDTPTDLEEAQIRKTTLDGDLAAVQSGVLFPEEVAEARFGRIDGFEQEIRIDPAKRAELQAKADEAAALAAEQAAQALGEDLEAEAAPGAESETDPEPEE
jgi:phage-related protein (TIGR01555 family)